jgi:hypothetical protein
VAQAAQLGVFRRSIRAPACSRPCGRTEEEVDELLGVLVGAGGDGCSQLLGALSTCIIAPPHSAWCRMVTEVGGSRNRWTTRGEEGWGSGAVVQQRLVGVGQDHSLGVAVALDLFAEPSACSIRQRTALAARARNSSSSTGWPRSRRCIRLIIAS